MSNSRREIFRVDWLGLWILFSAWCAISGWSLSALGELNRAGMYASLLLFILSVFILWRPLELGEAGPARPWPWLRARRPLPRVWLILTALALIGGLAYAPNNYDYLTYRFPRVLYWCWDQKWHWISTVNERMNYSGNQFEWMMVPSFILFRTDRLFFLINFISYLFFPGLIFSVFRGLGISGRISWWWMWVLPCGACYILQAGSVGNDSFAAVYLLAALHFLFRARKSASIKNLVFSTLAITLMTGAKASNLPLALPWAILLFFSRDAVFAKATLAVIAAVLLAAAVSSFLPLALMNHAYTGDFFGDPNNSDLLKAGDPLGGLVGNVLQIGSANLAPPLWYKELSWNPKFPAFLQDLIHRGFPRLEMAVREFPIEEGAGVGIGCVAAALLFIATALWSRRFDRSMRALRSRQSIWIAGGVGIAALVYMTKIASEAAPRLVTSYYVLVIASVLVLAALDGRVMGWRLFRVAGLATMLSVLPALILSPSRPLFPVQAVGDFLGRHGSARLSQRFQDAYFLYALRAYTFEQLIPLIPPTETRIGFLQNGNAVEASLWRPFGSHRVVEFSARDSAPEIKAQGVHWLVVSQDALVRRSHTDIGALLAKWSAHLVSEKHFAMTVHSGSETWYVVTLDGPDE